MVKLGNARRRALIGGGDQFLVSAGNFALLSAAAQTMDRRTVGAFGAAQTILLIILGLFGALYNEPALLSAGDETERAKDNAADASGAVIVIATALGLVLVGTSLVVHGVLGNALLGLGVALPFLAAQDSLRFQLIAVGQTLGALTSDIVFIVLWVTVALLRPHTVDSPAHIQFTIGGCAAVATLWSCVYLRRVPRLGASPWKLIAERQHIVRPLLSEFVSFGLVGQLSVLTVTGLVGFSASAGYRAAQAIFGPINTLTNAIRIAITPEFVRRPPTSGRPRRLLEILNVLVAIAVLAIIAGVLLLPDQVGSVLFKDTWVVAAPLLTAVGVQRLGAALSIGPLVGLRATGRSGEAARVRIGGATLTAVATVVAALLADMEAVAWTATATALISATALMYRWRVPLVKRADEA